MTPLDGQEREALEAARNAWHDETGKWPRQSGLNAAVRAALAAREEPRPNDLLRRLSKFFEERSDESSEKMTFYVEIKGLLAAREEPQRFSVREVEAMLEAAHTNAREPEDDDELPLTIEAAVKWAEDLLGRPVAAAREDTERPDATEPATLRLRAADVQKGDRIYARGDWWKITRVRSAEKYVRLTAESSDGQFLSSRTLILDDPLGVVRDTEQEHER